MRRTLKIAVSLAVLGLVISNACWAQGPLETQPAAWLQPLKPESQPLQPVPPDEPHAALVGFDANIAAPAEANKDEFFTLPELQEEMKKLLL